MNKMVTATAAFLAGFGVLTAGIMWIKKRRSY